MLLIAVTTCRRKKKAFVSGCKEKGTRKKLLLVDPIMTTGIHRSFVPNKLTRHKKTSPIGKAHFERATFSANNSDGQNRLSTPCYGGQNESPTGGPALKAVLKWQQTTSREPACHALRCCDPGSWPHPISWLPRL